MADLNAALMFAIAPHNSGARGARQKTIVDAVGAVLATTLGQYDMTANLRVAHFLAQICHESDGFVTTEEYADGSAYEGRADLGNDAAGDGVKYKGRGLIQLTGKANYKEYGTALALDLVGSPATAAVPVTSLLIACEFWKRRGLNALADTDDINTITRRINGGLNGLDSRVAYLAKAKAALGMASSATATVRPVLRMGASGPDVVVLQTKLTAAGYPLKADGSFGPGTDKIVKQFQAAKGMAPDGVVGGQTWSALG